jgi:hypothetical protein
LAGWGANNDYEHPLQHALLSDYLGRQPTDDECSRLRLLGWLYDYVCLLWSELYLRPAGGAVDAGDRNGVVKARAQVLAARLDVSLRSKRACGPRFANDSTED